MTNKIWSKFLIAFGVISAFCSNFIFGQKTVPNLLMAEEATNTAKLVLCDKYYDLPTVIYVASYDTQSDTASIKTPRWATKDYGATKYYQDYKYTISDQASLDTFNAAMKDYVFNIEQDAYWNYYEDSLSIYFLIVGTTEDDFQPGEELSKVQNSTLKKAYGCIKDVIVPDCYNLPEATIDNDAKPIISGYEAAYISNIDAPVTAEYIKSLLKASDNIDGDLTDRIVIKEDNYTANKGTIGEYTIVFEVEDLSGNKAEMTVTVEVVDVAAPIIAGPSNVAASTSAPLTISTIKQMFTATDNVDDSCTIEILSDKYTTNKSKPGTYEVTLSACDSSGNKGYKLVKVNVTDNQKPTISGASSFTKSNNAVLTVSEIMKSLTAVDPEDGDISSNITVLEDNYTRKSTIVGSYTLKFGVADSSGNNSDPFTVTVTVKDGVVPVFYIENTLINISEYQSMTHEDIINFLIDAGVIEKTDAYKLSFVLDEYTANANNPGDYQVSLKVSKEGAEDKVINLKIRVNEGTVDDINTPTTQTFWQRLMTFLATMVKNIGAFFSNTYKWFAAVLK